MKPNRTQNRMRNIFYSQKRKWTINFPCFRSWLEVTDFEKKKKKLANALKLFTICLQRYCVYYCFACSVWKYQVRVAGCASGGFTVDARRYEPALQGEQLIVWLGGPQISTQPDLGSSKPHSRAFLILFTAISSYLSLNSGIDGQCSRQIDFTVPFSAAQPTGAESKREAVETFSEMNEFEYETQLHLIESAQQSPKTSRNRNFHSPDSTRAALSFVHQILPLSTYSNINIVRHARQQIETQFSEVGSGFSCIQNAVQISIQKCSLLSSQMPDDGCDYAMRIDWIIWNIADPHTTNKKSAKSQGPTGYCSSLFFCK